MATTAQRKETLLQRLKREATTANVSKWTDASRNWFVNAARGVADPFGKIQRGATATANIRTTFSVGSMYIFRYDPKTKADLPYYDMHPLVIVMDVDAKGILGMNLHYLPPLYRTMLISRLLDFVEFRSQDKRSGYLDISYQLLKSSSKHRFFKPCVKRYLNSQIISSIARIPFTEWESAVFLPTASFQKAGQTVVWRESKQKFT